MNEPHIIDPEETLVFSAQQFKDTGRQYLVRETIEDRIGLGTIEEWAPTGSWSFFPNGVALNHARLHMIATFIERLNEKHG